MSKEPRRCILCNRTGMTKEHIFDDWITKVLPDKTGSYTREFREREVIAWQSGGLIHDESNTSSVTEQGDLYQRKGRNVCEKCNKRWGRFQDQFAKPTIEPLILGQGPLGLSCDDLLTIATWLTLTTIEAEFMHPKFKGITSMERREFHLTGRPLSNWRMWIGHYDGVLYRKNYVHTGGPIDFGSVDEVGLEPRYFAQTSTFFIGNFFALVFSTTNPRLNFDFPAPEKVVQIWPNAKSPASWPPPEVIDDVLGHIAAHTFENFPNLFTNKG